MKKLLFVVVDGGADTPNSRIGNKTPFQVADTPNLDNLARIGMSGSLQVLPIPPESDEAILSLLGYDVFEEYTGRGPLEAIGGGVSFKDGDLAIRCSFAIEENGEILETRPNISTMEARKFGKSISELVTLTNASFNFQSTREYRGVLIISSKDNLSSKISNTHPGFMVTYWKMSKEKGIPVSSCVVKPDMKFHKCVPLAPTKEATISAKYVNDFTERSKEVLEKHPVNIDRLSKGLKPVNLVLTRDVGKEIPKLFSLSKTYDVRWGCFADMPVERGIAQLAGMQIIPLPEPTKDIKKDMKLRARAVLKNLAFYDAVYIHLKGADPFSHIGDIKGKISALEKIDKYFFEEILEDIDLKNTVLVVTCDHTTSTEQRTHTADPVPLTIVGPNIFPDNVGGFNEVSCAKGSLKSINSIKLMPMLMKLIKR